MGQRFSQSSRSILVAGVALTLASCGGAQQGGSPGDTTISGAGSDAERAFFEQLLNTPYEGASPTASDPVDFASAFVDLPEGVSLQTGDVTLVADSGATRVEDFAIVYDLNGTPVGVEADEVLFHGFDPDAIADRIRGTNLDSRLKVADRIELRGVKTVGMSAVSELMMQEYIRTLEDYTPLDDDVVTELNAMEVFNYNFTMDTLLIDGFELYPFVYAAVEPAPENDLEMSVDGETIIVDSAADEERLGWQLFGAFARSFSLNAVAYDNVAVDFTMRESDVEVSMDIGVGLSGLRDYDRGDLAFSGSWDTKIGGDFPIPEPDGDGTQMKSLPMTGGVRSSTVSGVKLAKAFEALANWQMPASSDADLFDLGRWEMTEYDLEIADKSLFKAERILFESDFHWLLPTMINFSLTDTGYDIGNLFEVMTTELGEEIEPGLSLEDFQKGLDIAQQYGFSCLCGDYAMVLNWDVESGAISYRERGRFADAFSGSTSADIGFSTPDRIAGLFERDDPESEFETAFKEDFEFRALESILNDTGGLENLFEMLHAIGEAFPEQEGMAMLTYNDAAQLRMLSVNMVNGMKPMVRQQLPSADPWMDAVASFLEEGGSLTLSIEPDTPITVSMIESLDESDAEIGPEQIIEILGLTVTHTK